ncbi:ribonuclease kappa-B-like [Hydractinia symbiolongicarpus]|uniref:ribonuclease kappa-B-like n=1 Tax=Hydractinia symbiolongicarpus TaxID=13093 RepID=UPI00254CC0F9|nr:ribonuclease kappa-B-like [Hydractinia symbiolongicarpus]
MMSATNRLLEYQSEGTEEIVIRIKSNSHRKMPICGPKLSSCCFVLSIWGIIMLILMGVFFRIESVSLLEDVPSGPNGYNEASKNCFIAAGLYGLVFLFSGYQKIAINRGYSRL